MITQKDFSQAEIDKKKIFVVWVGVKAHTTTHIVYNEIDIYRI